MAELELRHLRTVRAVAEAGSISKAAAGLGQSQPALTAQLQRIERIIGGRLFERGPQGTQPTALGRFVVTRAEAVLIDVDALVTAAREHTDGGQRRELRIGAIALPMIGGFIELMRAKLGGVDLQTTIEPSAPVLVRQLTTGTVDVALFERFDGLQQQSLAGFTVRTLATEPLFVMLPKDHPAATSETVRLADLADDDWVLPPPHEHGVRWRFHAACEAAGFTPKVPHHTSDSSTGRGLVAQGAVALALAGAPGNGLAIRALQGDPIMAELLLAKRREDELHGTFDEVLRCARQAHQAVVDSDPVFAAWWHDHAGAKVGHAGARVR